MEQQMATDSVCAWPLLAFENAPVGMLVKSIDRGFVQTNRALRDMLGRSAGEFAQIEIAELIHGEDRMLHAELWKMLCSGRRDSYEVELRTLHREGHAIWCKVDASLVRDGAGRPQFGIAVLEDISDRKHFEVCDRRAAGRYESILNASGWGIIEVDRDGTIVYANASAAGMLGWSTQELVGQPVRAIHRSDCETAGGRADGCPIREALKDGLTRHSEHDIFHCRGGGRLPVQYTVTPVIDAGVAHGVAITFTDIRRRTDDKYGMPPETERYKQADKTPGEK
jgi:PAS domain S-box-containing protein